MNRPTSTLVISSRNRPKLLSETVQSVLSGTTLPDQLFIVDQSDIINSELAYLEKTGTCQIHYIHSRARGVSRARNEGMAAAKGEIVVLIDDDMLVQSNWYQSLIDSVVGAGPQGIVTGRVLPGEKELPDGFVPAVVESTEPYVYAGRIGTDVLVSCHMAMYRRIFQEYGGFDERLGPGTRFPAAEDNDYGYLLLEAGYQIVYAPQAVLYHRAWRPGREYIRLRWRYGRGKGGFYTKNLSLRDPYILQRMVMDILIRLVRFPWRVFQRPDLAMGDLIYVAGILFGSVEWLARYGIHSHPERKSATAGTR